MTLLEDAEARLSAEEARAWQEYLEETRSRGEDYAEVEAGAWEELRRRLRSIRAGRARLERDAAA